MSRSIAGSGTRIALVLAALAMAPATAHAQLPEDTAKQAAQELRVLVTEGTGVIGDLQPMINSGKVVKEQVTPDALVSQFKARYQKATGAPFDSKAVGVAGDARRPYLQAFTSVVTRFQGHPNNAGPEAVGPALFPAPGPKGFNHLVPGRNHAD